jgi:D-galactarolactone cycloisomerase
MVPHVWGSAIALAAAINVCFALPDIPASLFPEDMYLELDRTPNVFRDKLAENPIGILDGRIYPSHEDGLGIRVDENLIEFYNVEL